LAPNFAQKGGAGAPHSKGPTNPHGLHFNQPTSFTLYDILSLLIGGTYGMEGNKGGYAKKVFYRGLS
jgi:hypothetical protein